MMNNGIVICLQSMKMDIQIVLIGYAYSPFLKGYGTACLQSRDAGRSFAASSAHIAAHSAWSFAEETNGHRWGQLLLTVAGECESSWSLLSTCRGSWLTIFWKRLYLAGHQHANDMGKTAGILHAFCHAMSRSSLPVKDCQCQPVIGKWMIGQ